MEQVFSSIMNLFFLILERAVSVLSILTNLTLLYFFLNEVEIFFKSQKNIIFFFYLTKYSCKV